MIRSFRSGIWASVSATYFTGGRTTIDGARANDLQQNWRLGGTLSFPVDRHNSVKLYASSGVSDRTGNDFDLLGHRLAASLGRRALTPPERTTMFKLFQSIFGSALRQGAAATRLPSSRPGRRARASTRRTRASAPPPGYRRKLEPAVVHAIDHVKTLALGLPAPGGGEPRHLRQRRAARGVLRLPGPACRRCSAPTGR